MKLSLNAVNAAQVEKYAMSVATGLVADMTKRLRSRDTKPSGHRNGTAWEKLNQAADASSSAAASSSKRGVAANATGNGAQPGGPGKMIDKGALLLSQVKQLTSFLTPTGRRFSVLFHY